MPELRQNLATKEWVVIATERAKRPNAFAEQDHRILTADHPMHDPTCPFCPGNEELDLEVARFPTFAAWQTRVVRNKYPALAMGGRVERDFRGVERRISAVGHHEIVVEHSHHNTTLGLMSSENVRLAFETFQQRGRIISKDSRVEQIVFFKNHGERAGASLIHPHSQIIAVPMVPGDIRHRTEEARRFFDDSGQCVFCTMLHDELAAGERIVAQNEHFVVFVLYASSSPFHMWIMPRRHRASFTNANAFELRALGDIVRDVLARLYVGLNDPDYNMLIRSAPTKESENNYFHWYVAIVPRLSRSAGFELGSGVRINPSLPEACAEFLREIKP